MADQETAAVPPVPPPPSLKDVLQTFSDEAQTAAKAKAVANGFSLGRGQIPFEETLINLSRTRDILLNSNESGALAQLPLRIQQQLFNEVVKVSTQLQALLGGADAVLPFESAVEGLISQVWYSQLENLSGDVLGLQQKLNQLKTLERTLREFKDRVDAFSELEASTQKLSKSIEGLLSDGNKASKQIAELEAEAAKRIQVTRDAEQKITASLAVAGQAEKNLTESSVSARTANAEIELLKAKSISTLTGLEEQKKEFEALGVEFKTFSEKVKSELALASANQSKQFAALEAAAKDKQQKMFDDSTESRKALAEMLTSGLKTGSDKAASDVSALASELRAAEASRAQSAANQLAASKAAFDSETARLTRVSKEALALIEKQARELAGVHEDTTRKRFVELDQLENTFRDKILQATNYQLFHAFQTRQEQIAKGVNFWRTALFWCVGASFTASIILILFLIFGHPSYNAAFILKLGFTIPIIYAVHFCSGQYSKERQLEEEYAFKGNISVSLEPYRDLVAKMIDHNDPREAAKYSDFVISAVENVFTSPTQKILGTEDKKETETSDTKESTGLDRALKEVNDIVQSLAKLKND